VIEEIHAIGRGVAKKAGGSDKALMKYITLMNPNLPKRVGVFDPGAMKIVTVIDPRNNLDAAEKYIIYKSGPNDSPAHYSPAFRAKKNE